MPRVLHRVSLNKRVAIVGLDLVEGVHSLLVLLIVTTTDNIQLSASAVDTLVVVREVDAGLALEHFARLVQEIDLVHISRVFLEKVDWLQGRPVWQSQGLSHRVRGLWSVRLESLSRLLHGLHLRLHQRLRHDFA